MIPTCMRAPGIDEANLAGTCKCMRSDNKYELGHAIASVRYIFAWNNNGLATPLSERMRRS